MFGEPLKNGVGVLPSKLRAVSARNTILISNTTIFCDLLAGEGRRISFEGEEFVPLDCLLNGGVDVPTGRPA